MVAHATPDPEAGQAPTPSSALRARNTVVAEMASIFVLFCVYVTNSAGLIAFNKYLVNKNRFHYPKQLVCMHAGASSLIACLLLLVRPSLFTSLTDPDLSKRVEINWSLILKVALPIGAFFSVSLVLSNTAYLFASMSFLQMIKESNVVFVFIISVLARLEKCNLQKCQVLVLILSATTLTIKGELNFTVAALLIQGSSQLFESAKICLQSIMLSGYKLDTFTYLVVVMPCVFGILVSLVLGAAVFAPTSSFGQMPSWQELHHWAPYLVVNALIAFSLNAVTAYFIKKTSAVAYILAGIAKDSVIVLVGVFFMGEKVSPMQVTGFVAQLSFIFLWSMMRMFPKEFEDGTARGAVALVSKSVKSNRGENGEKVESEKTNTANYGAVSNKTK